MNRDLIEELCATYRGEIGECLGPLMGMLDVAAAQVAAGDEAGLFHSLRRAGAYWKSILENEKSILEVRARQDATDYFDSLPDKEAS